VSSVVLCYGKGRWLGQACSQTQLGLQPIQLLLELEQVEVTVMATAGAWRQSQLAGGRQEEVTLNSWSS